MANLETDQVMIMQIEELEENIAYSVEVYRSVSHSDDGISMNETLW